MSWSISQYCPDYEKVRNLHLRYEKYHCYEGRNRNVFDCQRYVVKLPKNQDGFADNDWEGSISNSPQSLSNPSMIQYPKTKLLYVQSIPVLLMEKITPVDWDIYHMKDFPCWIDGVDCGQVGYTKNNRLVAFDYGPR